MGNSGITDGGGDRDVDNHSEYTASWVCVSDPEGGDGRSLIGVKGIIWKPPIVGSSGVHMGRKP